MAGEVRVLRRAVAAFHLPWACPAASPPWRCGFQLSPLP